MKSLLLSLTLLASLPALAARPYHLELEAYPTAPFPYLGKFGTVTLHVYDGGVRAETFWLNGFSRNGSPAITVENPLGRMYTDVPITEIGSILAKLAHGGRGQEHDASGVLAPPAAGKVHGIDATRYRLVYGPEAWIDLWTTTSVPENAQLRRIVLELVRGISPGTVSAAEKIPGTPLYVELNFRRFKKLPILKVKKLTFDVSGEAEALRVGTLYFKAPLLDAIWK